MDKTDKKIIGAALAIWLVYVVLWLAFWGTVVYVAGHFIMKAW